MLKPCLRSEFKKVSENDDLELWLFTPSIFKAFPMRMEKLSAANRLRCVQEYFVGYRVFYVRKGGKWAGYCIVSGGNNPRYSFCSSKDIVFGRYFVSPAFRGQGIAASMLKELLDGPYTEFDKAYAYVHAGNKASHAVLKKIGSVVEGHYSKEGLLRRIRLNESGAYTLYSYRKSTRKEGA